MMTDGFLPRWTLKTEGIIMPDERLPTGQMVIVGLQHVVAMFGATVLAPILMGFDPNVSILFSGIATLIFFLVVGGRVPSYLGSSFAFIGPVLVATGASGRQPQSRTSPWRSAASSRPARSTSSSASWCRSRATAGSSG